MIVLPTLLYSKGPAPPLALQVIPVQAPAPAPIVEPPQVVWNPVQVIPMPALIIKPSQAVQNLAQVIPMPEQVYKPPHAVQFILEPVKPAIIMPTILQQ